MFKLFARVTNGLECVQKAMSGFLRDAGKSMVAEDTSGEGSGRNAVTYVQSLLDLRDQYNMFLEQSFGNHQLFKNAISSVSCTHTFTCTECNELHTICMYIIEHDEGHISYSYSLTLHTCMCNVCTCTLFHSILYHRTSSSL